MNKHNLCSVNGCSQQLTSVVVKKKTFLKESLLVFMVLFSTLPLYAASVLPLGLERLFGDAAIVFNGRCISNQVEQDIDSNQVVTYTTFTVIENIKGVVGVTYTIKQIGGYLSTNDIHMEWPGIPRFTVGDEYVVFLPAKSDKGFSSPVGLEQGKFSVQPGVLGKEVTNGMEFNWLVKNLPAGIIPDAIRARIDSSTAEKEYVHTHSLYIKKTHKVVSIIQRTHMGLQDFLILMRSMNASR